MLSRNEVLQLAEDIELRGLQFAQSPDADGLYEMPSEDEHNFICAALREMALTIPYHD